jgi:hypothetical protein
VLDTPNLVGLVSFNSRFIRKEKGREGKRGKEGRGEENAKKRKERKPIRSIEQKILIGFGIT